jgi:Fur family ferric uptake transcriptional regulator
MIQKQKKKSAATPSGEFSALASLRKAGYKTTPGRVALLDILGKSRKPLSIPEIMDRLSQSKGAKIDQVTIYRTLDTLGKIGLVRKVDLRHGHSDYELAAADDHHHLVCIRCGQLEDFQGCNLDQLARRALKSSKDFAIVTQHSLEFFGLCKACAAAANKPHKKK